MLSSAYLSSITPPDQFITDQYVNTVLSAYKWSEHGSSLDEFIDSEVIGNEELPFYEEFDDEEADFKVLVRTPEFNEFFKNWLHLRYQYILRSHALDESNIKTKYMEVHRTLYLSADDAARLQEKDSFIGRYWSLFNPMAYAVGEPIPGKTEYTVTALVLPHQIDWKETLISRFDYDNGDGESEITIKNDAVLVTKSIFDHSAGEYVDLVSRESSVKLVDLAMSLLEHDTSGSRADMTKIIDATNNAEFLKYHLKNGTACSWASEEEIDRFINEGVFQKSALVHNGKFYSDDGQSAECIFDLDQFKQCAYAYLHNEHDERSSTMSIEAEVTLTKAQRINQIYTQRYQEAMALIGTEFNSKEAQKRVISSMSDYYSNCLRAPLMDWAKDNGMSMWDVPMAIHEFKKAAIARFANYPNLQEILDLSKNVDAVRKQEIVKKKTVAQNAKENVIRLINHPLLGKMFERIIDLMRPFDEMQLKQKVEYYTGIQDQVLDMRKRFANKEFPDREFKQRMLGITRSDIVYGLVSQNSRERLIDIVTNSVEDASYKRNYKIADQLEKAGVTGIHESTYTHSPNGFDGMFSVDTDKGPKSIHINTIMAGGYNIQELHLRVLVKINDYDAKKYMKFKEALLNAEKASTDPSSVASIIKSVSSELMSGGDEGSLGYDPDRRERAFLLADVAQRVSEGSAVIQAIEAVTGENTTMAIELYSDISKKLPKPNMLDDITIFSNGLSGALLEFLKESPLSQINESSLGDFYNTVAEFSPVDSVKLQDVMAATFDVERMKVLANQLQDASSKSTLSVDIGDFVSLKSAELCVAIRAQETAPTQAVDQREQNDNIAMEQRPSMRR